MTFYTFGRGIAKIYVKLFYRVEFIGCENEPAAGGFIVISNHSSYSDPLFTACGLKHQISFIAKSSLAEHAFFKWLFRKTDAIPVRRGESDLHAIRTSVDAIKNGRCLGVYPQGTRCPGVAPEPSQALSGIGLIARKTKATLLPVTICYGKRKPTLFRKVRVYIGKPITFDEYTAACEEPDSAAVAMYCFKFVCDCFSENNHG